jgi:UDP-glucose 4-epimerase
MSSQQQKAGNDGGTGSGTGVLITGGTGFVGRHLTARLVALGRDVHLLVRSDEALRRLGALADQVTVWKGDLTNPESLKRTVEGASASMVYHLAARTDLRRARPDLSEVVDVLQNDVIGSTNLLAALAAAPHPPAFMVQTGSLAEYGTGPFPSDEDQREQPISGYSAGLVMRTHLLQALQVRLPFPAANFRLALVYGPGQHESFLVPALISAFLEGRSFTITNGEAARDVIHVDDVVDALVAAEGRADLGGEVINIGTGVEHPTASIGGLIAGLMDADDRLIVENTPRIGDQPHFCGKVERALHHLGWKSKVPLEDGLKRTIASYRHSETATATTPPLNASPRMAAAAR